MKHKETEAVAKRHARQPAHIGRNRNGKKKKGAAIKKASNQPGGFLSPVQSVMLMVTYRCQLACSYCGITQKALDMPSRVIRGAIELLLTTRSRQCQARFWGGEPLIQWGRVKDAIVYAHRRASQEGKSLRFMITTNGVSLTKEKLSFLSRYPVEIMYSLDGPKDVNKKHRTSMTGQDYTQRIISNLHTIIYQGIPYFVNVVVTPDTAASLSRTLTFLNQMKVSRVQLCYQCGSMWPQESVETAHSQIDSFLNTTHNHQMLMNFQNECEPTMLSQEVLVDTDGKIYFDGAVFLEKQFPRLRSKYYVGTIEDVAQIDTLYRDKRQLFSLFGQACNADENRVLHNNIEMGFSLERFFISRSHYRISADENAEWTLALKQGFRQQRMLLDPLRIPSGFLYVAGPCVNNCLFCIKKDDRYSDVFKLEHTLQENRHLKQDSLCIVGNEPLMHPDLTRIIRLAKRYHFKDIQIMTSGELLAQRSFAAELIGAGVSSFSLPLYAPRGALHDTIVGTDCSFRSVLQGIDNIRKCGGRAYIHTNLIKHNLEDLKELERFVKEELVLPFIILPVRPKRAQADFGDLMPSYGEIISKLKGVSSLFGFPLCVVAKIQERLLPRKDEISDSMKVYLLHQKFIKTARCTQCTKQNHCVGLFNEYIRLYGTEHVKPVSDGS